MEKEKLISKLEQENYDEILELIEDAEKGRLEELEIVESLGLLYDRELNDQVLSLMKDEGVNIIYIQEDASEDGK
ncbi:hypothetical protein CR205_07170 [Alteribacter lacisalsi]|uniref:Uncharacterized protein n=1 Tax=Alteribacter lacisalsi TaxID=2045244 RepID=A0A2W0HB21_9BACI|nr:hypothetical protein [Alteribacter lacisalsi]PYZ98367.1 hypothetical protein CR205_07170 [Alteribacter lacisalsi]